MSVGLENVVSQPKVIIGSQPLVFGGAVVNAGNQRLMNSNTPLTSGLGTVDLAESTAVRTLTLNGNGNVEFQEILRDSQPVNGAAGKLREAGTGTVMLKAANTYTGNTTISGGAVRFWLQSDFPRHMGKRNSRKRPRIPLHGIPQTGDVSPTSQSSIIHQFRF